MVNKRIFPMLFIENINPSFHNVNGPKLNNISPLPHNKPWIRTIERANGQTIRNVVRINVFQTPATTDRMNTSKANA
jgi:hypothetical protein